MAEVKPEVIIIGGGFAGLTAGVALAEAGKRVCVLEQKPHLGGRARSFHDPTTGSVVDNGQHLFMGCYHATRKFLQTIGTSERVEFQPRLSVPFLDRSGRITRLDCPDLPSPWHLLLGVLRSGSFTFRAEARNPAPRQRPAPRARRRFSSRRRERYDLAYPARTVGGPSAQLLGFALHCRDE